MLLETGDALLLENSGHLLLEADDDRLPSEFPRSFGPRGDSAKIRGPRIGYARAVGPRTDIPKMRGE